MSSNRSRFRFDCPGKRVAAEGAESDQASRSPLSPGSSGSRSSSTMISSSVAPDDRAARCEVERDYGECPLAGICTPIRRARSNWTAGTRARFLRVRCACCRAFHSSGPLVLWIPPMRAIAKGEDPLLGARTLLVPTCPANGRIETVPVERLLERLRLHHVRVHPGAMTQRSDAACHTVLIDVNDEIKPMPGGGFIAEPDHFPELPGGVHVQQRKRRIAGRKRLQRQVKHDCGVLADRVQHHGPVELRGHFPNDVYALGLKASDGSGSTRSLSVVCRFKDLRRPGEIMASAPAVPVFAKRVVAVGRSHAATRMHPSGAPCRPGTGTQAAAGEHGVHDLNS